MKNIKLFETHSQYSAYINGSNVARPNVSYCEATNHVHFNRHDYSMDYFTTEALEDGEISFNIWYSMGTDMITSISYSTDYGETWTTTQNTNNKQSNLQISVEVEQGDKVLWKGTATQMGFFDYGEGEPLSSFFSSDCEFNASGNVMSLLYGDNFFNQTILNNVNYIFASLFHDYNQEERCQIVSAEHLILPSTTLTQGCYQLMFHDCTSLITAPVLPATTLGRTCYYEMFWGCTSLTTAPVLPATTLASSCYQNMFSGCTSLTMAPILPATTMAYSCYDHMFSACTTLTTAPVLPATTLANSCYYGMFSGCSGLTTAPTLPVTILANGCYRDMFYSCTSLTTAPVLPATTLYAMCYGGMFRGCTALTTAPELPATTLAQNCYYQMFQDCSSLNYIKAMFTTTPSTTYTQNWVSGVAASGTFVKNSAAQWSVTATYGVPSGWTVQTASE